MRWIASAGLAIASLGAGSAAAVDGVIEINQASALAGVALGDAPGFPVTLVLRGSYRLTSELNVPADATGIIFQNDQIHLDLNGFSISGGGGTKGYGVESASDLTRGQRVRNGVIRFMPEGGIKLGKDAQVDDVTVIGSGGTGIKVGGNSRVRDCTSIENTGPGIHSSNPGTRVTGSIASSNGHNGIWINDGEISHSVANGNALDGIYASAATNVTSCTANDNAGHGISAFLGVVTGNSASGNQGYGLNLNDTAGYLHNVLFANNDGFSGNQVDGGVALGPNLCYASTLCP